MTGGFFCYGDYFGLILCRNLKLKRFSGSGFFGLKFGITKILFREFPTTLFTS